MHYSKRFIAFGGIVAIAFLIKYNIPGAEYEQIGSFRGASLEAETWNPLIASSVNDNLLSVIIDNKQYTNEKYKFYMDDNLDIMMPVSILRDAAAHIFMTGTGLWWKNIPATYHFPWIRRLRP